MIDKANHVIENSGRFGVVTVELAREVVRLQKEVDKNQKEGRSLTQKVTNFLRGENMSEQNQYIQLMKGIEVEDKVIDCLRTNASFIGQDASAVVQVGVLGNNPVYVSPYNVGVIVLNTDEEQFEALMEKQSQRADFHDFTA